MAMNIAREVSTKDLVLELEKRMGVTTSHWSSAYGGHGNQITTLDIKWAEVDQAIKYKPIETEDNIPF